MPKLRGMRLSQLRPGKRLKTVSPTLPHLALTPRLPLTGRGVVTVYGAGGKTSLMERLARELADGGKRVIQTTTTKIFLPETPHAVIGEDLKTVAENLESELDRMPVVVLGATLLPDNKLSGIDPAWPGALLERRIADYVIVEADGSAHKPIKGYASYEPVFPSRSDVLVPVLGVEAIGNPVDPGHVHRAEAFCKLTGARPGAPIDVSHFLTIARHMIDLGRQSTPGAAIVPLINKVDTISDCRVIREIAEGLKQYSADILFTALREDDPVRFLYQAGADGTGFGISAVILAAGESLRMGRPKLSLEIRGKTILEHALAPVAEAGIRDVVIVFSAENEKLKDLVPRGYRVVINRHSKEGISTSLKAGLSAVDPRSQGILFALGDQPFVGSGVYKDLIQYHRGHLPLITCPVYEGKRGNPVIFDRRLWPALMKIKGDEGGKQIMAGVDPKDIGQVKVDGDGVLIDIDTPEEYEMYGGKEGA